jgi:phage/plasmid-like protein (TIGR03299 family)
MSTQAIEALPAPASEAVATDSETAEATQEAAIRRLPWAGIATGNADGDQLTSAEMLKRAGLDWEVGIRPLYRHLSDGTVVQSERLETYRMDDESVELGAVKSRYEVLQNKEAFAFGDSLVDDGTARWEEAGQQHNGSRVFMTMLLNDEFTVLGQEPFKTYLFLGLGHDGGRSVRGFVTPIRVWCTNQTPAVRANNLGSFTIQHTSSMQERLATAGDALRRTNEYQNILREEAELLAATQVTDKKAKLLIASLIPARRASRDKMIDGIMANYASSPTVEGYRGTGWGLLNATTEYFDHIKPQRTPNARFESITFGEGAKVRNELASKLAHLN